MSSNFTVEPFSLDRASMASSAISYLNISGSNLVFIDITVPDYQQLVAGVVAGHEVYVLNAQADAITQITEVLANRSGIQSIHIISHGEAGELHFGGSVVNSAALSGYAAQLQSWQNALINGADILLYGCNVAKGDAGKAFVSLLSELTGANIAASNNLTGSSTLNGDWDLEVQIGPIESVNPFTSEIIQAYANVLVIKVAVVADASGYISGFNAIRDQLNNDTYFDFDATVVSFSQVDTVAELNAYNTVIIGNSGYNAFYDPTFASALRTWVESGGGLVSTGWIVYGDNDLPNIDAVVPVNTLAPYQAIGGTFTPNTTVHPVTSGITPFGITSGSEFQFPDSGATVLATMGGGAPVAVVANKGSGKSVYLGPLYSGEVSNYNNADLRFGNADRLLEQAVAWAGTPNVAPGVSLSGSNVSYIENEPAILLNEGATVTDSDSPDFNGGNLTINFQAGGTADDRLTIRNQGTGGGQIGVSSGIVTFGGVAIGTLTGGIGTTPLVVTFNSAAANPAAVQALLSNITYSNVSETPSTAARTVQFVVNDGDGGTSSAVTRTVNVFSDNDVPINSVPGAQTINEDGTLVFSTANGNAISISDLDAGTNPVQVTLTATNGTFSLSGISGLSGAGDGTNETTLTFTGTLANINAALNGLSFRPTADFNGAASLAITTNDQGNTGGVALTDLDTINITVNAVNDAPRVSGRGNADKVAILGVVPTFITDVVAKVQSTGLFTSVDSFDVSSTAPTLAQLQTYDSVLFFSDGGFNAGTALGNNLADYVDGGGGVVLNTFAFNIPLAGRWSTGNYTPIQIAGQSQGTPLTLGTIFDPNHPILQGVNSFNGGPTSYYNTGNANPNATVIANWSNGRPLVVDLNTFNGGIVGLNFVGPSSDVNSGFWTASTDGELLMGNALEYVGNAGGSVKANATEDNIPFAVDLLAGATDADGDTLNVSNLVLTGGSAAGITVNGNSLSINPNAYNSLAAGAKETITYTYDIVDGQGGSVAQTATVTIDGIDDAPTAAILANTTTSLNENSDTTSAIKVADIVITDVDGGNNLSLTGADAASFTIVGNELYLNAGVALNFEAKSSYSVNVVVDAPGVGVDPDFSLPFTLTVANVNEAPTDAVLANTVTTLAENTSTTNPVKVADINITDDALGTENLTLTGTDAGSFTIINGGLYVKAGETLNFEAKSTYNVDVVVDDPTVGNNPDLAPLSFTLTLTDVNETPTVANLSAAIGTLAENSNTSSPIKVADIIITDDALGTESLTLAGPDANSFTIIGNGLYVKAGETLNFEAKSNYVVIVSVDDPTVGNTPDFALPFTLSVTNVNEAPTAAGLANTILTLAENTNTSSPVKVADINITDDALGTETLTLTGADASFFTITNNALYLQAGTVLNFESKATYNVNVVVDDTTVGVTPDFTLPFSLTLTDVNEAPTALTLTNQINTLGENTSTANTVKVADITFTDDALGTETLSLSGADANFFTITNNALYIKSGVTLDFETKSTYSVAVNVDDASVGNTPDAFQNFNLTLTNLNDAPVLLDTTVALASTRANAAAPVGAVGTLVSQLVGFASESGQKNVTDQDANAKLGVAITATNSINGTWHYSINNGTNWNTLGSVSDSSARLLAADANTRIYFQPNPGYTGSLTNAITFRAWDQTSGTTNGSLANTSPNGNPSPFSTTTDTASLDVRLQGFDFNGDSNVDIFWRNGSTGDIGFWSMNGATVVQSGGLGNSPSSSGWTPVSAGDLTGDGKADILWQNRSSGENAIWEMNGTSIVKATLIGSTPANSGWEAVGVGDFTGDGKNDILWRERNTGENGIWEMNGTSIVKAQLLNPIPANSGWEAVGVGDLTNDGKTDILWRNRNTGENGVWEMNGTSIVKAQTLETVASDSGWRVAGIADYNKDGSADILWRNSISGQDGIWTMNGTTRTGVLNITPDVLPSTGWNIVGANY